MTVKDIVEALNLKIYSDSAGLNKEVTGGYTSDLLSDVMGNAPAGAIWITLQTHVNVMAVATLKDISAVILVKGLEPEANTVAQSNNKEIPILGTNLQAFEVSGMLYNLIYSK
ncbi:MAG TPA: serine kinase [Bacteroidales bacterium]|nr:serine kinase [Bacteroidales bacterium]